MRIEEERGELGRGDLKADFGEFMGFTLAEVAGEMILDVREAKLVLLLGTPFLIADSQ